jgi:hypothetical protein
MSGAPRQESKPNAMIDETSADQFTIVSKDDALVEIVGLRAEIKVWSEKSFDEVPGDFLQAYDLLTAPIKGQLRWYQNYTMNRMSPATARTLSAPRTWLERGQKPIARMLYMKGPDDMKAAGQYVVDFSYYPQEAAYSESNTSYIRQATPWRALEKDPESYLATATRLCDLLPALCGHVGYSLETSPYYEMQAFREAYGLAMRHPGVNIATDHATWPLRDEKGIEAVNWLTIVGSIPLEKLGGAAALRRRLKEHRSISVIDTQHGVIIRAGERPRMGDVNRRDDLPEYRAVYAALKDVMDQVLTDFSPLPLGLARPEKAEKTARWLRRFES